MGLVEIGKIVERKREEESFRNIWNIMQRLGRVHVLVVELVSGELFLLRFDPPVFSMLPFLCLVRRMFGLV